MRLAARFIATMALAVVVAPVIFADDGAKPEANPKKSESAASVAAPALPAKAEPSTATAQPARMFASPQSESGAFAGPVPATRRWDEPEDYFPKVEWFLGYSFWRALPTAFSNRMAYLHGGSTSVAYNLNRYVGLVADFGGYDNSRVTLFTPTTSDTFDSNGSAYTYLFGPRFSYRAYERFTPFAQALFGGTHASSVTISGCTGSPTCTPLGSDNAFATALGAGLDIRVSHHVALRLLEGDFLLTHFRDSLSTDGLERGWQKNVRLSTGVVFRFGGNPAPPPPNRSPVASCSVDRSMVYAGSGDLAVVSANASDPDNDPLTYSWTASGGTVEGTGPEARWNSAGVSEGTYTVRVRVDDGRGGTAGCSADVRVEPRPNRPPTMSCSADRSSVPIGEAVQITATANDPDNDVLTYSWDSTGGRVRGAGMSATFDTAGLKAGSYSVRGHVDDGHGGTADCQLAIEVQAPPPPPEMTELETKLALHSIYFPTARPSAAKPDGGLVESQEKILATLAEDFKRYLTFRPDAHLILGGHADERGSEEYNKALTDRRVGRTRNFLVGHGVSADAIETRSFGKEDELNAEQVKEQIADNPDLSSSDRQQLLGNLQVIVLANNRRVDVTLSTTGQQSTRRYPFNARDFLALINTKGAEAKPRNKPAPNRKAIR
jgi:outer membrane protein OmpA-like peptidoglycan-associated protein/opacity protein-like surface antigen